MGVFSENLTSNLFLAGSPGPSGPLREGRKPRAAGPHRASWSAGQRRGGGARGESQGVLAKALLVLTPGAQPRTVVQPVDEGQKGL